MASFRKNRSRFPSPPPSSSLGSSSRKFKRPFLSPPPTSKASDQDFLCYCFPCDSHGLRKEAHAYCESCMEFLCHACYKHHRKAKTLRKHKLLEKEMLCQVKLRAKSMTDCTGKCPKHPEEIVTWFCRPHFQSGCHVCKGEHHDEDCALEPGDGAKDNSTLNLVKELDILENKADQKIARAFSNLEIAEAGYNAEVERIKHFRQMLKNHLDTLENDVLSDAIKISEEDKTAMDTIIKECGIAKEEIQRMRKKLSNKHHRSTEPLLLRNNPDFVKIKAILSQNDKCNSVRRYHFELDEGMFQYILGCTEIGKLHVAEEAELSTESVENEIDTESSPTTTEDDMPSKTNDENDTIAETRAQGTISVKSKSDKKHCFITGMSVLSNDEIVIADSHNNCIKVIDTNNKKVVADVKLSFSPQDLTAINKNQIAVTLPCAFLSMIQLVSRFGPFKWKTNHSLKANGNCYGITSTEEKLIVSFTAPPKIEILGLKGNVLQTIQTGHDSQCFFSQPWYLVVSQDEKYIYVTDRGNGSLTRVSTSGNVDDVIQVSQETGWNFSPEGIAVADDTVLVCDTESDTGNVYGFMEDLAERGVVYDSQDGLRHPKTICFSPYRHEVFISCHDDTLRSKLFVFKL